MMQDNNLSGAEAANGTASAPSLIKELSAVEVARQLAELYPDAHCSLDHRGNVFHLFVMAILSAQCTDKRVNEVALELFREYPDCASFATADILRVEELVRPCGLYRTKAKNIVAASRILCERHGGRVPDDFDSLLSLPGVGRKIANLIRGDVYGLGGIVADTHCIRICQRIGFTEKADPLHTERIMEKLLPTDMQSDFCHRLVLFGRDICTARSPRCGECPFYWCRARDKK